MENKDNFESEICSGCNGRKKKDGTICNTCGGTGKEIVKKKKKKGTGGWLSWAKE